MRNLLSAGFSRLWRSRIFWLCVAFLLVVSAGSVLNGYRMSVKYETGFNLDDYFWSATPYISITCAVFSSLFFGTEYSDGTLRNKLIVGHKRRDVYLSSFAVCFTAALIMMAGALVGGLAGLPLPYEWSTSYSTVLVFVALFILMAASLAAICTFIAMLSHSKAVTAVITILVILGLLMLSAMFYNALQQPETYSDMIVTANGIEVGEPMPNPNYVSGVQRDIYEFLIDLLPPAQTMQITALSVARPVRAAACSVALSVILCIAGVLIFRKKDLK